MITSLLQGGLGNQMFQISVAVATAKRIGVDYGFDFNSCHTPGQGNPSNQYTETLFKNIKNNQVKGITMRHHESSFKYVPIPLKDNTMLVGFYQNEKYFKDYVHEIKNLFNIQPTKLEKHTDGTTAIHVRRGDFLKHPNYHPTCTIEYYKKAMKIIGKGDFIFVSDDIGWCKDNFKGDNIRYSDLTNEIDDMSLICSCDNAIISNSTFSWWGAYLNKNKNKKIIAPKNWFGPEGPKEQNDITPESWIKI